MDSVFYRGESGRVLLRSGLLATFYARKPIRDAAPGFEQALKAWLRFVPPEGQRWALIGSAATEYKALDHGKLGLCFAQLDATNAEKKGKGFFSVAGPESPCGAYSCRFSLSGEVDEHSPRCQQVEMVFPLETGSEPAATNLVRFLASVAAMLGFDSGYASPALVYPYGVDIGGARKMLAPLAMRHPGYDLPTHSSGMDVGGRCRGARWLTFLGPTQVSVLGGSDALTRGAAPGVSVLPVGQGVMIRAGENAELGDVNQLDNLPLLRAVAKQIEPVTLFGDRFLPAYLGARAAAWERRFLD